MTSTMTTAPIEPGIPLEAGPPPGIATPAAPPAATAPVPPVMRAMTYEAFGSPDVLRLGEVAVPRPGPGQVLIRIRAAAANPWDWHFLRGLPYIARLNGAGVRRPKHPVPGGDVAGDRRGRQGATRSDVGDEVFGFIESAGLAEYAVAPVPARHDAATRTFESERPPLAATTALQGLRDDGRDPPRRPRPRHRRVGRRRDLRGADREVVRRPRHGRRQWRKCRPGPRDRCRPRRGLHARGRHRGRDSLRRSSSRPPARSRRWHSGGSSRPRGRSC